MPAAKPRAFRRRAIALARAVDQPIGKIAADRGSQTELLDRAHQDHRNQLAKAVFRYLEGSPIPRRRHSALGYFSLADYETAWNRRQLIPAA